MPNIAIVRIKTLLPNDFFCKKLLVIEKYFLHLHDFFATHNIVNISDISKKDQKGRGSD
jgi:hypothetical protein